MLPSWYFRFKAASSPSSDFILDRFVQFIIIHFVQIIMEALFVDRNRQSSSCLSLKITNGTKISQPTVLKFPSQTKPKSIHHSYIINKKNVDNIHPIKLDYSNFRLNFILFKQKSNLIPTQTPQNLFKRNRKLLIRLSQNTVGVTPSRSNLSPLLFVAYLWI